MKWNCGLSRYEKWEMQEEWHQHFAWLPCRVASNDCRWFEWVERRITVGQWDTVTEYRPLPEQIRAEGNTK